MIQTYGYGSHRLDTLVLDNNKINNKRFEILRELFKNFNVNNLSLRNCDLSELSVSYIGDFLKTNEVIKSINLLPRPAGVKLNLIAVSKNVFGFNGSGCQPFNQAPFAVYTSII